jgi:hypothetical protein
MDPVIGENGGVIEYWKKDSHHQET